MLPRRKIAASLASWGKRSFYRQRKRPPHGSANVLLHRFARAEILANAPAPLSRICHHSWPICFDVNIVVIRPMLCWKMEVFAIAIANFGTTHEQVFRS